MMRVAIRWSLLWLAACVAQMAHAQGGRIEANETSVKAAFLFKFASYVEWPDSAFGGADAPFVFGAMGAEDVAAELERIVQGKTIQGRRAAVRRVKEGESTAGLQMLFVARGLSNIRGALRGAQQPGLLVVTELERGLEMGSAINFVIVDDRVGFEVSVEAAERSGLKISSRMLNVARRVVSR